MTVREHKLSQEVKPRPRPRRERTVADCTSCFLAARL